MQPHAFELVSMGTQNHDSRLSKAILSHDSNLVTNLRHHAGKPQWNATGRLRACLDGSHDWQPEPRFVSGYHFFPPRGRAAVECTRTPSSLHQWWRRLETRTTIRIWLPICATTRTSRSGMQRHAFELVSMVATIGNQNAAILATRLWLPICATTRTSRLGMQPHAFELASMVATIGNQNHDSHLVANLSHHADEPPWNAPARLR